MGHVQEPHSHEGTSLTGRGGREVHGTDLGRRGAEVHIVVEDLGRVRCMVPQYRAMHVDEVQVPQRSYIDPWYVIGAPTVIGAFTVILESSFNEIM